MAIFSDEPDLLNTIGVPVPSSRKYSRYETLTIPMITQVHSMKGKQKLVRVHLLPL